MLARVRRRDPACADHLARAGSLGRCSELGALIAEVAPSKVTFLVTAAEADGFGFADGAFLPADSAASSFAVKTADDLASIDDRGRRLQVLANDSPADAVAGALELVESVCRTVLHRLGVPSPRKSADLSDVVAATLDALSAVSPHRAGAEQKSADVAHRFVHHLGSAVATLGELQGLCGARAAPSPRQASLSPSHGRLAVSAAVSLAGFIAETSAKPKLAKKR